MGGALVGGAQINVTRWAAETGEPDSGRGTYSLGSRGQGEKSGRGTYSLGSRGQGEKSSRGVYLLGSRGRGEKSSRGVYSLGSRGRGEESGRGTYSLGLGERRAAEVRAHGQRRPAEESETRHKRILSVY